MLIDTRHGTIGEHSENDDKDGLWGFKPINQETTYLVEPSSLKELNSFDESTAHIGYVYLHYKGNYLILEGVIASSIGEDVYVFRAGSKFTALTLAEARSELFIVKSETIYEAQETIAGIELEKSLAPWPNLFNLNTE